MMKKTTYALTDADIREAVAEWLARQESGDGPHVATAALSFECVLTDGRVGDVHELRATVEVDG